MSELEKVIQLGASKGLTVDKFDAANFLQARDILKSDPTNEIAREVVSCFTDALVSGTFEPGFVGFMLPHRKEEF